MRDRLYWNEGWMFQEKYEEGMPEAGYDVSGMRPVRLPHTCKELPFHYFDEQEYQMLCGYRKVFVAPKEWEGKHALLTFEGAAHESKVFLNGKLVGEHHCGYTAFTVDLSDGLQYGQENVLAVRLDSRESLNVPPFGFVIDYMTYGGIYRDVYLEIKEEDYLEDVFLRSEVMLKGAPEASLISEVAVSRDAEGLSIRQQIRKKGEGSYQPLPGAQQKGEGSCQPLPGGQQKEEGSRHPLPFEQQNGGVQDSGTPVRGKKVRIQTNVGMVALWDTATPNLYEICTQLLKNGNVVDEKVVVFGFRRAEFLQDGFYLNGKKCKIRGLNRHQSYPYVGYAMPKSMQRMDADILKKELGLNAVRTSHYPQSHYFLERCDELGLLVFTELPGWQHIGDDAWKEQAIQNVRDMVKQYRNHTSIILWGVRINESKDDDAFYQKTNEAAHLLDPWRPTGGVRAHKKSSFLEDVYTYNDFVHDGTNKGCEKKADVTPDVTRPYLISEYNGHMYPTKSFDCEEHRLSHALRHANVLDAVTAEEDIAGSFGWCMADYNTHKDFGSGDRICYHGVLDMFRNPKMAANVYASQQEEEPVLAVSSSMDIGEHPGCNRGKTYLFTNADSVRMYKNGHFVNEFHREDSPYRHLAHGPIVIEDYIGDAILKDGEYAPKQAEGIKKILNAAAIYGVNNLPKSAYAEAAKLVALYHMKPDQAVELYNRYIGDWGGTSTSYQFEAVRNGERAESLTKEPMRAWHLEAKVDHFQLREEASYDVAAVRIQTVDEYGNLVPYLSEPILAKTTGAIELIGPKAIPMRGGMAGTYVKTAKKPGPGELALQCGACEIRLEFQVEIANQSE